jgi:kumamolisin
MLTVLLLLRPNRAFAVQDAIAAARHFAIEPLLNASAAESDDVEAVRLFARKHRLRIVRLDAHSRHIVLRGPARAMSAAFGALGEPIPIPQELPGVLGVFGLNNRPVAKRPGRKHFPPETSMTPPPVNPHTRPPKDFREVYEFPKNATGKGQSIGVLEFGGGFSPALLRSYLRRLGIRRAKIEVREIPPGANRPSGTPGTMSPDTEVYLDLEVLASIAPDAKLVVYFAENSSRGWIEALRAAIFDSEHRISVLSISWGAAERNWDAPAILAIDHLFQMAALLGITVCCASGDSGVFEDAAHPYSVPFPASSPHVLACGGTRLEILSPKRKREIVWNDSRVSGLASGGGVSRVFGLPAFQEGHRVPSRLQAKGKGRGLPDVAANASAATGYLIWSDETAMSLGGTSAATPLWAGLVACLNEALGRRAGYLTPLLYARKRNPSFNIIARGNNRLKGQGYNARKAWDACTGLGSPRGVKLLEWLKRALASRSGDLRS